MRSYYEKKGKFISGKEEQQCGTSKTGPVKITTSMKKNNLIEFSRSRILLSGYPPF